MYLHRSCIKLIGRAVILIVGATGSGIEEEGLAHLDCTAPSPSTMI